MLYLWWIVLTWIQYSTTIRYCEYIYKFSITSKWKCLNIIFPCNCVYFNTTIFNIILYWVSIKSSRSTISVSRINCWCIYAVPERYVDIFETIFLNICPHNINWWFMLYINGTFFVKYFFTIFLQKIERIKFSTKLFSNFLIICIITNEEFSWFANVWILKCNASIRIFLIFNTAKYICWNQFH